MISELRGEQSLLGCWVSDPEDFDGIEQYGHVSLEFSEAGRLKYTVFQADKRQIILLTYRVEQDCLITNQQSVPREERTKFEFTPCGKLKLLYEQRPSTYVRKSADG